MTLRGDGSDVSLRRVQENLQALERLQSMQGTMIQALKQQIEVLSRQQEHGSGDA